MVSHTLLFSLYHLETTAISTMAASPKLPFLVEMTTPLSDADVTMVKLPHLNNIN